MCIRDRLSASYAVTWLEVSAAPNKVRLGPAGSIELPLPAQLPSGDSVVLEFEAKVRETVWTRSPRLTRNFAFLGSDSFLPCVGANPSLSATTKVNRELVEGDSGSMLGCGWGKSTLRAELTAPATLRAVGSGAEVGHRSSNSIAVTTFESKVPVVALWGFGWGQWVSQSAHTSVARVDMLSAPGHRSNASRLLAAAKQAIASYSESIGPYPYPVLTLVEVPRWHGQPTSYPGLIAIPESVGFRSDYEGARPTFSFPRARFDQGTWAVAHEVAHQWWGNQILPARQPGSQFLTESLAEFGAYRVAQQIPHFDSSSVRQRARLMYLSGRWQAGSHESALAAVESEPTVAYAKGLLVMSEVQRLIGEAKLDAILSDWFRGDNARVHQLATPGPLIDAIIKAAPLEGHDYVRSLFFGTLLPKVSITASGTSLGTDGKWLTRLCLDLENNRSTSLPVEIELQQVDLSQRNAPPIAVAHFRTWLTPGNNTVDVVSKVQPVAAEVDRQMWLIDDRRDPIRASTPTRLPPASCAR